MVAGFWDTRTGSERYEMRDYENRLIVHDSTDGEVLDDLDRIAAAAPTVIQGAVIHGLLEMVDLKSAAFRLVDAVGNAVDLEAVRNPTEAGSLIGLQVTATGPLLRGAGAKHHAWKALP